MCEGSTTVGAIDGVKSFFHVRWAGASWCRGKEQTADCACKAGRVGAGRMVFLELFEAVHIFLHFDWDRIDYCAILQR